MGRSDRWAYMRDPRFNPPSDKCPICTSPSKVYFVGSRTEAGERVRTFMCEHQHRWEEREGA